MFALYDMERDLRIDPIHLNMERLEAIRDELNRTMSNRVMLNIGLCIGLWDIRSVGTATIFPGDGGVISKVNFRYVVFRPFYDEIILGTIRSCTSDGVHVTMGFFDDILVPPEGLQYPSRFDEREQNWIWEYSGEDNESHEMYMDTGETIRFRVVGEHFTDTTPIPLQPPKPLLPSIGSTQPKAPLANENSEKSKLPYRIIGSINEPGLGLLNWWN